MSLRPVSDQFFLWSIISKGSHIHGKEPSELPTAWQLEKSSRKAVANITLTSRKHVVYEIYWWDIPQWWDVYDTYIYIYDIMYGNFRLTLPSRLQTSRETWEELILQWRISIRKIPVDRIHFGSSQDYTWGCIPIYIHNLYMYILKKNMYNIYIYVYIYTSIPSLGYISSIYLMIQLRPESVASYPLRTWDAHHLRLPPCDRRFPSFSEVTRAPARLDRDAGGRRLAEWLRAPRLQGGL